MKGFMAVMFTALGFIFDVAKTISFISLAPLVCFKLFHPLYALTWPCTIAIPLVLGFFFWFFSVMSFMAVCRFVD